MADESIRLRVGQERPVRLAPHAADDWSFRVDGMTSAVDVRKMWTSRPYEEDEEDGPGPRPPRAMVFVIRAMAPGDAAVRFRSAQGDAHDVTVHVEP
ncbi:MAG: hypothetical protein E6G44_05645 [Actinobacteria bacterium]|nr:MAG: hypothetical protein E6G44_05645 [Actinomycetota bacterium]